LTFPDNVTDACTNIPQVAEEEVEEEEEEQQQGDTPHVDTWRNARAWG
jgi:hypothetical protein